VAFSFRGAASDERRDDPRRFRLHSLQSRLVTGVVGLVVVLVIVIGASTWFALRWFLDDRLDEQVQTTANGDLRRIFGGSNYGPTLHSQEVWAVALSPNGEFLGYPGDRGVDPLKLSPADRKRAVKLGPNQTITVRTTNGHTLRIANRPFIAALEGFVPQNVVAVVGLSTSEEHITLGRLFRLELVIGGIAVGTAFVITTWGVRRSLRNLYAVTGTAREVAGEISPEGAGLDRRVPVAEDDTEMGQLAESMNTLLAAVETQFAARVESEHRMREFLADASHELRTPLTSIKGYAELARLRGAGEFDDDFRRIHTEGDRMKALVEDLLTLARTGQDDVAPQWHLIDVGELLDDVAASARAAFPEREISIEAPAGVSVIGEPDQLLRVVLNLVTNAAVHTDPVGPITVRASPHANDVLIQVADAGPGLPPDQAARVFERFWRADKARSRSRGGTGLGLSIVASLVHDHGGTVRFDSSVEGGSTVTVRLPAATP
jgi:two-component system OmpR family sensor kinase